MADDSFEQQTVDEIIGTVFRNTAASPATLERAMRERLADWIRDNPFDLPWFREALKDWSIVGMNHYRVSTSMHLSIEEKWLYVAMTNGTRVIVAQHSDQMRVWDELERKAILINAEREFLAATVAVRREIDNLVRLNFKPEIIRDGTPRLNQKREREAKAWELYRDLLEKMPV